MALYTVTVRDCDSTLRTRIANVRAADEQEARTRAVAKLFGRRAFWWPDSGLGPTFGQVCVPARTGGNNCITGRLRVDVRVTAGAAE